MPKILVNEDNRHLIVLKHISNDKGAGFNEIWRALKNHGFSFSYSTLSSTLKILVNEGYVKTQSLHRGGIPKKLYQKTPTGCDYEDQLQGKITFEFPTKRIMKAKHGPTEYGQVIFSRFPFSFEIELSNKSSVDKSEDTLTKFLGEVGETIVHNSAEILNNAYTNFLTSLSEGRSDEALNLLKEGLDFQFKLIYSFDGGKVKIDKTWSKLNKGEKELLQAGKTVTIPSYTEIMGAWLLSFLKPLNPQLLDQFDLSKLEGWAELITYQGNHWRKLRGMPLLKKDRVYKYLQTLESTNRLNLKPFQFNTATLELQGLPEPKPHEFYSFLAGLFSNVKIFLESEKH